MNDRELKDLGLSNIKDRSSNEFGDFLLGVGMLVLTILVGVALIAYGPGIFAVIQHWLGPSTDPGGLDGPVLFG